MVCEQRLACARYVAADSEISPQQFLRLVSVVNVLLIEQLQVWCDVCRYRAFEHDPEQVEVDVTSVVVLRERLGQRRLASAGGTADQQDVPGRCLRHAA